MKYTLNRDLAIFELRHSLPLHHGVPFSFDELQVGQQVDIFTYPKENISPFRSLLWFHGTFKGQTNTGLLEFDYSFSGDKAIRPGASGGIVVDSKTHLIVGILSGIARNGEPIALGVPHKGAVRQEALVCRGGFSAYQIFASRVKMAAN